LPDVLSKLLKIIDRSALCVEIVTSGAGYASAVNAKYWFSVDFGSGSANCDAEYEQTFASGSVNARKEG